MVVSIVVFPGLPFLAAWIDINPTFRHSQTKGKWTKCILQYKNAMPIALCPS